jgi:hypothetical protein
MRDRERERERERVVQEVVQISCTNNISRKKHETYYINYVLLYKQNVLRSGIDHKTTRHKSCQTKSYHINCLNYSYTD